MSDNSPTTVSKVPDDQTGGMVSPNNTDDRDRAALSVTSEDQRDSVYGESSLAYSKMLEDREVTEIQSFATMTQLDAKATKRFFWKTLHIRFEDIVNDFADVETFLILFDALFIELVSSPAFTHVGGAQTVSFIAAFEFFLAKLRNLDGRFKLVFVEDFDLIYDASVSSADSSSSSLAFLRNALKLHILNTDVYSGEHITFKNLRSSEFEAFVRRLRPSFTMAAIDPFSKDVAITLRLAETLQTSLATLLHDTLFQLLVLNQNIVFLNGLRIEHTEVLAYRCDPRPSFQRVCDTVSRIRSLFHSECERICEQATKALEVGRVAADAKWNVTAVDSESAFWSAVLAEYKRTNSSDKSDFLRDFAAYLAVKPHLPLQLRTQRLDAAVIQHNEELYGESVKKLFAIGSRLLTLLNGKAATKLQVADLYDGRLFVSVSEALRSYLEADASERRVDIFNPAQFAEFERICKQLNIATQPFKAGHSLKRSAATDQITDELASTAVTEGNLVDLRGDLIETFFDESIRSKYLRVDMSGDRTLRRFNEESFRDKHHWHTIKLLKETPCLKQLPDKLGPGGNLLATEKRPDTAGAQPKVKLTAERERFLKQREANYAVVRKIKEGQRLYDWIQFYGIQLEGRVAENPPEFRASKVDSTFETSAPRAIALNTDPANLSASDVPNGSTEVITSANIEVDNAKDGKNKATGPQKKGKVEKEKPKKLSKAEEIRLANEARRSAQKTKAEGEKITFLKQTAAGADSTKFLDELNLEGVDSQLERLKEDLAKLKDALTATNRIPIDTKRREAVRFFEHLRMLTMSHLNGRCSLSQMQCAQVNAYWQMLNFDVSVSPRADSEANAAPKKLTEKEKANTPADIRATDYQKELLDLQTTLTEYQLAYAGRTLDVRNDPTPDRRVAFTPDSWQVRLLDAVDNGRSVLVVAPTSVGKTFVSYYAIEKVLRESDDDVVVYVAPTKALVQQVAATIYARFRGKVMPTNEGRKVFGYFSRDYHVDVLSCQVLVTVPQCLEVLLLSAAEQNWTKRLRYVIFDEVHCIGDSGASGVEGTASWERIIAMIPCPFVALSATVGNPETLLSWLQGIEGSKQITDSQLSRRRRGNGAYQVELVTFGERYSELELYLYAPQILSPAGSVAALEKVGTTSEDLVHLLHPFAAFTVEKIKIFGIPKDQCLTARQVYDLYEALRACAAPENKAFIDDLQPNTFFSKRDRVWLNRADLREYETTLKQTFLDWLRSPKEDDVRRAERVIELLGAKTSAQLEQRNRPFAQEKYALDEMHRIVGHLKQRGMLPSLCFAENRSLCELLGQRFMEQFEAREKEFLSIPENVAKVRDYEKRLARYEKDAERRRERESHKLVKMKTVERGQEKVELQVQDEDRDEPLEMPAYPLDLTKFTLVPRGMHSDVFDRMKERLMKSDTASTRILIRCLQRGIGYHHPGLTTRQRSAVEMLFRSGYLQVLFSTSTLALGVHMPCKSVIFGVDSKYLTPLQYRQMSGRAGRRGFDKAGNVVFLGLPTAKMSRLISAGLSRIRGRNPFSVSLVLRLLLLIASAENRPQAIAQCLQLLRNPLRLYSMAKSAAEREQFSKQMGLYFVYALRFLARFQMLNQVAEPIGFAGIAAHLHDHEPGNFVFIYLLQTDGFHLIATDEKLTSDEKLEQLVLILCYLFTHQQLSPNARYRRINQTSERGSASKLILDPLPKSIETRIIKYNNMASSLLAEVLSRNSQSQSSTNSESVRLPYSQVDIASNKAAIDAEDGELSGALIANSLRTAFQHQLLFLSGASTDAEFQFTTPTKHLVSPLAESVHFDVNFLPTFIYPVVDNRGLQIDLNAYALDFFRHRSRRIIERDNLSDDEAYNLLYDFQLVLQSIVNILTQIAPDHDPVRRCFEEISYRFYYAFSSQYRLK